MVSTYLSDALLLIHCKPKCRWVHSISMLNLSLKWRGWICRLSGSVRSTKRTSCDERHLISFDINENIRKERRCRHSPSRKGTMYKAYPSYSSMDASRPRLLCLMHPTHLLDGTKRAHLAENASTRNKQHLLWTTTPTRCENSIFMIFGDLVARGRMYYKPIWATKAIHIPHTIQHLTGRSVQFIKDSTANKVSIRGNRLENDTSQLQAKLLEM